jgi:hypothetical protein
MNIVIPAKVCERHSLTRHLPELAGASARRMLLPCNDQVDHSLDRVFVGCFRPGLFAVIEDLPLFSSTLVLSMLNGMRPFYSKTWLVTYHS